ncbi:cation:proton antiporter [Salinispira pacifica]|uniref:Cation/H+ exchanger transmembrane domain-containing protein n=1 Tax=Salinispira pacifica TaxID=1307761 RepID=V5WM95_9SPIO|nr:cation:proton antiporter [Salinispira pacifica]AHC16745.1 hypothetical protein L21SP2_3407 [Salinispira pacifica]
MIIQNIQSFIHGLHLDPLIIIGVIVLLGIYFGKGAKLIHLPSIIGFMVLGVLLGPSLLGVLSGEFQESIGFITEIALSFVAVSIGLELSFASLKKQGGGIVLTIFTESFMAFILVSVLMYLLTRDLALSILFGAIAPASAPAGTVAIIQEYRTKGPLTKALFAVVGFDDGLGIIVFGFAAAFAKSILSAEMGMETGSFVSLMSGPLMEVGLSLLVGSLNAVIFIFLGRFLKTGRDLFLLLFAMVFLSAGLSIMFHMSVILTNMVLGIVIVNTQPQNFVEKIHEELTQIMPLLFILFFVLAGSNLHISALPELGLIGLVYIAGRATGLISGASFGAWAGRLPVSIRKYLGLGILSQAGVAIGLALIVKKELAEFGAHGAEIGDIIITTVSATSIFFEIIGPVLAKFALTKAGEIRKTA